MNDMTPTSMSAPRSRPLAAAKALRPLVDAHREALAAGPDLPPLLAEALIAAGLTQLWLPRALGGPETHPLEYVQVIEELARQDGSVAWCVAISSGVPSWATGLFAAEPLRRMLPNGAMFAGSGSGNPTGTATRDGDGWRVNGRWSWASFCRYSNVSFFMCVEQEDGGPRRTADGQPVVRGMAVPSEQVRVVGNWNSFGLKSSGSHDVECADVWVPEDCTAKLDGEPRQLGPLYRLPMFSAAAISALGIPLGIAAGAIDAFIELARRKTAFARAAPLCEQEHVQLEVAWAKTRLLAARAFAFETIGATWESLSSGRPASVAEQALLRMACCHAGEVGREVTNRMYQAAGSTAVLETAPFAAKLRDVEAACQHVNFATRLMVPPGRVLLGLEPGSPRI